MMEFQAIPKGVTWLRGQGCVRWATELNEGMGYLLKDIMGWLETNQCLSVSVVSTKGKTTFIGTINKFKPNEDKGLTLYFDIADGKPVVEDLQDLSDNPEFVRVEVSEQEVPRGFEKFFGTDRQGVSPRKSGWSSS